MFSYIEAKNEMFFKALEAKLNGELDGVIILAQDVANTRRNLYALVFTDEKGYKRSLWCPEHVVNKNVALLKKLQNAILIKVDRSWHDDSEKIETMISSGVICYMPEDFSEWRRHQYNQQKEMCR